MPPQLPPLWQRLRQGESRPSADHEDYWRFTLLSYHSGISCFQVAVYNTRKAGLPVTWENLETQLDCKSGSDYVNGVMDNLFAFDFDLYQLSDADINRVSQQLLPRGRLFQHRQYTSRLQL